MSIDSESPAIIMLARAIDKATDARDEPALLKFDKLCAEVSHSISGQDVARVHYLRSNIHAALQDLHGPLDWNWRQWHRERQLLFLRQSVAHPDFGSLENVPRAQTLTNLGNALSSLGRCFEALVAFERALIIQPRFAMAVGNRGLARLVIARSLDDDGHRDLVATGAHVDLCFAIGPNAFWDGDYPDAVAAFANAANEIAQRVDVEAVRAHVRLDGWSLGVTPEEQSYREWALRERLFLNPLNDLGQHSIAARDALVLPDHTAKIGDPPHFISWFNHLKVEFATARLLFFESHQQGTGHYGDHDLKLINTLDYAAIGTRIERMKLAFRASYSLLDKVAGFLNAYLNLQNNPDKVSMANIWTRRGSLQNEFTDWPNLHLRALYWLSFDIRGDDPGRPDSIAPEAAELHKIRNILEHRCLVLHDIEVGKEGGFLDRMSIDRFAQLTLQMLSLARNALMHLALAVRVEEQRHDRGKLVGLPIELPIYGRDH